MWRLFLVVAILAATLPGCPSDSNTNPNDGVTNDRNKLTVNGNGFSNAVWKGYSDESKSQAYEGTSIGGVGAIVIKGLTTNSNEEFTCNLTVADAAPGTYTISATAGNSFIISYGSPQLTFFAATGTVTVTQFDTAGGRAKGTFNGTLTALDGSGKIINVTNGTFDVQVIAEP